MALDHLRPEHIADLGLSWSERAQISCVRAQAQKEAGNYEAACRELEPWWRVGERPWLDSLDQRAAAEVLLRAGALAGCIGSTQQVGGAQEMAKSLLSGSITLFELLGEETRAAEGQVELAYCYYREGMFDQARNVLRASLAMLPDAEGDLRVIALVRSAIVERHAARLHDALRILLEAAELAEASGSHSVKGRFHFELATTLKNLGVAEKRSDHTERALIEYEAATFHFERLGHTRNHAAVENNLGLLFFTLAKFDDAHEHLDRARSLFTNLRDDVHCAQVDETRAQVLLAEGRYADAEEVIREALQTFERSGQQALLAEALTTCGVVLARSGRHLEARPVLERARHVGERCSDWEGAGRAALALLEELFDYLGDTDRREVWARADQLLATSQDTATLARLDACAEQIANAHAEYERRRAQLAQVEKLAALGELAFGVAHDFNNTLAGILGRAQLLKNVKDAKRLQHGLDIIIKAAEDGAHTVKRIQDFARLRRDHDFVLVAVDQVLVDVSEITRPRWQDRAAVGAHINLNLRIDSNAVVMGDAPELREVLINMVFNAVDAMPAGGTLTLSAAEHEGMVEVAVGDTGTGMTQEVRTRIFDPFFTTKGTAGTGMGLAVSYGIIRRHEGSVEVESEPGRGTIFRIKLPIAPGGAAAAVTSPGEHRQEIPTPTPSLPKPTKILVVDDELFVRELLRDILESEGYEVVLAARGHEALGLFEMEKFDAMFTDVGMPEMSGWELARSIRERDPLIPLIIITGWGEAVGSEEQRAAQVDWVITKPFNVERITEIAREIPGRREAIETRSPADVSQVPTLQ